MKCPICGSALERRRGLDGKWYLATKLSTGLHPCLVKKEAK